MKDISHKESVIAKRDDGFFLAYAKGGDFSKLKNLNRIGFSKTPKIHYEQWLFRKNPSFQIFVGQTIAKISLVPSLRNIVRRVYPFGYVIIIKCISENGDIVGVGSVYNFSKIKGDKLRGIVGYWIIEKFQKKGLGVFMVKNLEKVAKEDGISQLVAGVMNQNIPSQNLLIKLGWNESKDKSLIKYSSNEYDMKIFQKFLE